MSLAWRDLGIQRGDRVAILSENRPEWSITDYSLLGAGAVSVPLYTSLPPAQIEYILTNSGCRGILVESPELLEKVLAVRKRLPHLEHLVLVEGEAAGVEGVRSWLDLMRRGADLHLTDPDAFARLARSAEPDDLASIIYTSGTTGPPKGVMLTHRNFVYAAESVQKVFGFTANDRTLSFLPLSHVFQRFANHLFLMAGVSIIHVSLEDLTACLPAMRPTVIASVPRLFEKMLDRVEEKVAAAPPGRQRLFRWAQETGRRARLAPLLGGPTPGIGLRLRYALADLLVLRKVRKGLGGRLKHAISGGAPLRRDVLEYFAALGLEIIEGYGLTETSGGIAVNLPGRIRPGTVGPTVEGTEIRIAGDGEVLFSGPGIMRGYHGDREATREALRDGWLHTGDIGTLDEKGCLAITDRKKDLIVTSGGKNVAPQVLEAALCASPHVSQAVVVGNGRRFIAALLVPDPSGLERARRETGTEALRTEDAVRDPRVLDWYQNLVREALRDFAGFEQVKRISLLPREFTIEAGELTPTMKVRRRIVEKHYADSIEALYAGSGSTSP